jgi:hypothetical protein
MKGVLRLLHTDNGRYAISFILGLGLASLFRKVCNDRNCMIFKAAPISEVTKNVYAHGAKCFSFKEQSVKCDPNNTQKVNF